MCGHSEIWLSLHVPKHLGASYALRFGSMLRKQNFRRCRRQPAPAILRAPPSKGGGLKMGSAGGSRKKRFQPLSLAPSCVEGRRRRSRGASRGAGAPRRADERGGGPREEHTARRRGAPIGRNATTVEVIKRAPTGGGGSIPPPTVKTTATVTR